MNEAINQDDNCAENVPAERERLASLLRIAMEQWHLKTKAEKAKEIEFIKRDLAAFEKLNPR